jgi:two-component system sensor histidine kinase BaeS
MLKSIRSRLSLSFAGIALLVALSLGLILLEILQRYYSNLELAFLQQNARAVSGFMAEMLTTNASHEEVLSQVENLTFLSQTRIRVYDQAEQLLYDSGEPQNVKVNLGVTNQLTAEGSGALAGGVAGVISVVPPGDSPLTPPVTKSPITAMPNGVLVYRSAQASGSPFRFDLSAGTGSGTNRSTLVETIPITGHQNASVIGSVELSEGPDYGSAVLPIVARGWAIASAIAILLAAGLGWYISRRFSAPVFTLTYATTRMANGDLSSRADIKSQDELGQLARSFNSMAGQVETTVSTLRRFVSDAAHELRTPLTALHTNLDLALDENDAANRSAFISRAQGMVKRLEELNTNLLDLSRLEANGLPIKRVVVDLAELLRSRIEVHASQAEQAGLDFDSEISSTPLPICADQSQIGRVLDNLVDNACKFTAPGGAVQVKVLLQGEEAVFSVTDTGIGIPAEDLPQIFNRFHRGRNTTAYPGSGLGLAIVKAIVSIHGGQVDVQSAGENKGSQFSIRLPIALKNASN